MPRQVSQEEWNYWYDKIYGFFYRRIEDEFMVEELTAETLNKVFLSEQEIENIKAFMWKTAKFKFYDYLDSKKTRKSKSEIYTDQPENLEEPEMIYSDYYLARIEDLKRCVRNQLKENDFRIVEMCIMYDFNSQEAAQELGMTDQNVRQRLSRALKKVRQKCREIWIQK